MQTPLRDARVARGWSQARALKALEDDAARRRIAIANRSSLKTMLSRWENGHLVPDEPYRLLWQSVYDLTGEQLGFTAVSAVGVQPIQGSAFSSSSVGPEVLAGFQSLLAQYVSVDAVSGPRLILGAVQAHLVQLEELCGVASGRIRADLLDVGARFTEFAGWLHQDAGDTSAARYWTNRAMDYALELGDARLTSYVLMRKSNIETDAGHVAQGLGLADAALRSGSDLTPGLRALALRQKAYLHALAGERDDAIAAIDKATAEVDNFVGPNEPEFTAYCSLSYIEMESAHSWAKLGKAELAAHVYSRSLTGWPQSQRRDQGLGTARLAGVYATLGDIEQAASQGQRAAELLRQSPSARTLAALRSAAKTIAMYRKLDCVKEFQHSLSGLV